MDATNSTAPTLVATDSEHALGFHVILETGNGDEVAGETRFTLICDE